MKYNLLKIENKKIRSQVIRKYLDGIGVNKVVCFSCGNASRELKNVGLDVLDVSESGSLIPNKWFNSDDFLHYFPEFFNATSGYLPLDLMAQIGEEFRKKLGELESPVYVASGSGETIICLKLAYPTIDFIAVYDDSNPATVCDKKSPLFPLVELLAKDIIQINK